MCDEQSFERSAALGCIKGPSEAGKTEIPVYTVRSERLLMEEFNYNLLFRWFVGLNMDDPANIRHPGSFMPATTEMRARGRPCGIRRHRPVAELVAL